MSLAAACILVAPLVAVGGGPPVTFEDASELIPFEHVSLPFGGGGLTGAAWFDYNNDGWIDLFLANGKTQPNALFENDGNGGFVNVAARSSYHATRTSPA